MNSNYHRELSDLQQTNVNLQSALNSNTHETKKGLSREPLELIKRLQFQGDEYTRKIETERRLITNLESNLKVLRSKVEQQRMQMGGIGGAERKQKEVARRLSQMENRLDNALIKYNSRVAENRHLKSDIDNSRRQRLVYDNIYTGLELELAKKKKSMASLISKTSLAMQKQDRLKSKLVNLQKQIEGEQNEFDKKWHSLGTEIAMGREAHTLKLKKELEAKGLLTDGSENIDSNETNAGNEGTTTGDGANGTEGGKANGGEQTMERKTKRKLARGAWAIAKEKAQIHMSSEKIQAYEVAFEKIREITGIADIEVLVDRFIEAEERNFSTFKYISHLNKELEKLDTQIHEARTEIERFRGQGVETDSQRKKILRELESKLHRTETRTKDFDDRHNRVATLLTSVKKRVQDIFQRIGCRNSVAAGFVGNQGVTDSNLMQHLGIIEQRTNEVLQMYAASGAAYQEASKSMADDGFDTLESTSVPAARGRRLSLGVGPQQASGSHVVRVDPPGMEEQDSASPAFMMDESARPMTRVELLRMIKEKPSTNVMPSMHESNSNGNEGGRRKRR